MEEKHYVPEKEYVIKYSYTGPWKNGKTFHVGRFFDRFSINSDFGVTDDGKYAVISEYKRSGISMVDLSAGKLVWNNASVIHIRKIVIREEENEMIL